MDKRLQIIEPQILISSYNSSALLSFTGHTLGPENSSDLKSVLRKEQPEAEDKKKNEAYNGNWKRTEGCNGSIIRCYILLCLIFS
jgi:hypothetical protein